MYLIHVCFICASCTYYFIVSLVIIIILSVFCIVPFVPIFYCAFRKRILLWYDITFLHDTYYFICLVVWSCISHQLMLEHPLTNTTVYRYNNIMRLLLNYLHLHTFITYFEKYGACFVEYNNHELYCPVLTIVKYYISVVVQIKKIYIRFTRAIDR